MREVAGFLTSSGTLVIFWKYAMLVITHCTQKSLTANLKLFFSPPPLQSIWILPGICLRRKQCLLIKWDYLLGVGMLGMLKSKIYIHTQIWWDTPKMKKCCESRKKWNILCVARRKMQTNWSFAMWKAGHVKPKQTSASLLPKQTRNDKIQATQF